MAATFSDLGSIANDANFQRRVGYAVTVAAVNVYSEAANTAGHPARVAFAIRVFNGGYSIYYACLLVLTNATIAAGANFTVTPGFSIIDSDIQFAVNSLWNDLAGV